MNTRHRTLIVEDEPLAREALSAWVNEMPMLELVGNPIAVNPDHVKGMAAIWCTKREIATVLGISVDTLNRRFRSEFRQGRAQGKTTLRRKMWDTANGGNVTMQIFLSKQWIGYRDAPESKKPDPAAGTGSAAGIDWSKLSNDERDQMRRIVTRARCPKCQPTQPCAEHAPKVIITSPAPQLEHNG